MPPLLTIDTIVKILHSTVLQPFPALLTLLSVAALGHPISSPAFKITAVYLATVTLVSIFQSLDARLASGRPRTLDWQEEVVVVTGGAGGLGGLIAAAYGMRGVPVAVLDSKYLNSQEQAEWEDKGITYYRCDVGDRRQVEAAARSIEEDLGIPTILVNGAAVVNGKQFLDLTEHDIDRTYRVNVLSHYHTIQTFLPKMLLRPHGGTIVTVSSVLGFLGCAGLSAYTSSKSALTTLHHSLRAELLLLSSNPPSPPSPLPPSRPQPSQSTDNTKQDKTPTPTYPSAIRLVLLTPGQLDTPLFSRITPPSTFLGPTVSVAELAAETIRVIDKGVHAEIAMPLYARWIGVMGVLPVGIRGVVRSLAGLDGAGWRGWVLRDGAGGGDSLKTD